MIKGRKYPIVDISFVSNNAFVTVGPRHCKYWELQRGAIPRDRKVSYGRFKPKGRESHYAVSIHRGGSNSAYLLGGYDGHVYKYVGKGCMGPVKGPSHGKCYAIHANEHGIVSGGRNGTVCLYNVACKHQETFNVGENVRSLFLQGRAPNQKILVGTYEGSVYEIDVAAHARNPAGGVRTINSGHGGMFEAKTLYAGEVWGLCMHPTSPLYATVGWDRSLCIFNAETRQLITKNAYNFLTTRAQAVDWSPDGTRLAVAQKDGRIVI